MEAQKVCAWRVMRVNNLRAEEDDLIGLRVIENRNAMLGGELFGERSLEEGENRYLMTASRQPARQFAGCEF
jgi:hypothetical protein